MSLQPKTRGVLWISAIVLVILIPLGAFFTWTKFFREEKEVLCKRRRAFQVWLTRGGGRSRYSVLSLAGFAPRFSRSDAGPGRLQIVRRGMGRRSRNSRRL